MKVIAAMTSSSPPVFRPSDLPSGATVSLPRTVVLVGLMGAGKTSIGRRLAGRLGLPFRDADAEIEASADCTVEEIFARHGEAAFRVGERKVIARLLEEPPEGAAAFILATGGGAFMDPDTRALIRRETVSVWLRADVELLLARTARRGNRPLLKQGDPREILERLIAVRYPVYAEADIIIDCEDGPQEAMVDRVLAVLTGHFGVAIGGGAPVPPETAISEMSETSETSETSEAGRKAAS